MALIYLLGMLHMFSKVILAVNIIPLLWGLFRTRYTERHVFVLLLTMLFLRPHIWVFYLAMILFLQGICSCPQYCCVHGSVLV